MLALALECVYATVSFRLLRSWHNVTEPTSAQLPHMFVHFRHPLHAPKCNTMMLNILDTMSVRHLSPVGRNYRADRTQPPPRHALLVWESLSRWVFSSLLLASEYSATYIEYFLQREMSIAQLRSSIGALNLSDWTQGPYACSARLGRYRYCLSRFLNFAMWMLRRSHTSLPQRSGVTSRDHCILIKLRIFAAILTRLLSRLHQLFEQTLHNHHASQRWFHRLSRPVLSFRSRANCKARIGCARSPCRLYISGQVLSKLSTGANRRTS